MIRLNQQKSDTMKNKIYENVLMLCHCAPPCLLNQHSFSAFFFFETLPYYYSQLIFHQRDAKTLEAIIKKRVRPGTHILTDCWPAYSKLDQLEGFNLIWHHKDFFLYPLSFILYFFYYILDISGYNYTHDTVNHSEHFKDPISGVHTNTVEGRYLNILVFF